MCSFDTVDCSELLWRCVACCRAVLSRGPGSSQTLPCLYWSFSMTLVPVIPNSLDSKTGSATRALRSLCAICVSIDCLFVFKDPLRDSRISWVHQPECWQIACPEIRHRIRHGIAAPFGPACPVEVCVPACSRLVPPVMPNCPRLRPYKGRSCCISRCLLWAQDAPEEAPLQVVRTCYHVWAYCTHSPRSDAHLNEVCAGCPIRRAPPHVSAMTAELSGRVALLWATD